MSSPARSASAIALTLALACGWAPTASQATVSAPRIATASALDVEGFAIAMNPSGDRSAVVAEGVVRGTRGRRTQLVARFGRVRSLARGRTLENLRPGSGAGASVGISAPQVAVAPDGGAVAGWIVTTVTRRDGQPSYRLRVATAPDGRSFGRPRTLLTSARSQLELTAIVAGRGGLAVLGWRRGNRVEVAVRRNGRFARPQRLSASSAYGVPPSLASAPGGAVVAAWSPAEGSAARAAVLPARARRFNRALSLSAPGEPANHARAAGGPGGAGVAWTVASPIGSPARGTLRFARLRTAAGTFAAPVTLADADASGGPHVAIPRVGIATAWRHLTIVSEAGDNDYIRTSRLAAAASWLNRAAPRRLSEPPALAARPALAALGDRALIAWEQTPAYNLGTPIRVAVAGPDGWLPTETIAPQGPPQGPASRVSGIDDDERPSATDLRVAAGRRSALLAWITYVPAPDGNPLGRVHVASYAP